MNKILTNFIIVASFLSCTVNFKKNNFSNKDLLGRWALIDEKNRIYKEIEFSADKIVTVYSIDDPHIGPIKYELINDTIIFHNEKFKLEKYNNKINLVGTKSKYILIKIPFEEASINKNQINPIYIRKSYFFIHLNLLTTDNAIEYLKNIEVIKDSIVVFSEEKPL